jgi:O-antigen/teichoic acid export membrane protein
LSSIKKLAGQTAIYGVGTILGRVLNYLLTPLYTSIFSSEIYAVFNEGYAYIAILLVVLTYGMETALFQFAQQTTDKKKVFSTAMISLLTTTIIFWSIAFTNTTSLAEFMKYPSNEEYIFWLGLIIGFDAITALPMAWLRLENRPKLFSLITLSNIGINIGLNLFFLFYCRNHYLEFGEDSNAVVKLLYNHDIGVGYVFISNLIASLFKVAMCLPVLLKNLSTFDFKLWKNMIRYSWPLLIAGLGFIINERLDVLMLKHLLPYTDFQNRQMIGIYSASYKIAILMSIFIQAFRFAAEPFFFQQSRSLDAPLQYARIMNYFVAFCSFIFLFVMLHLDIIKYFLQNEEYWKGLEIVPIIMLANMFLGIYINLSMWYKLSGQTIFGAIFSLFGALITIAINYYYIPVFGYMASAYATLITYFLMVVVSYWVSKKYYPIPYQTGKIIFYILLSFGLYFLSVLIPMHNQYVSMGLKSALLIPFVLVVYYIEFRKSFQFK